ncbi:hypothetical protein TMEC54S_04141 [Thauera mechernichensis]
MVAEVASGQVRHESLGIKFMAMRINGWWRAGMPTVSFAPRKRAGLHPRLHVSAA